MKEALFKNNTNYIIGVRKYVFCTYLDNIEYVMIGMSPCTTYILYARRSEINEKVIYF